MKIDLTPPGPEVIPFDDLEQAALWLDIAYDWVIQDRARTYCRFYKNIDGGHHLLVAVWNEANKWLEVTEGAK